MWRCVRGADRWRAEFLLVTPSSSPRKKLAERLTGQIPAAARGLQSRRIDLHRFLEAESTDLRASFGGMMVDHFAPDDQLPLGAMSAVRASASSGDGSSRIGNWSAPANWATTALSHPVLRVVRGAHWDRFQDNAKKAMFGEAFSVTANADRMVWPTDGPELNRSAMGNLSQKRSRRERADSRPNGKPILLLGDCQTIGWILPKIAHVITADLPIAAQLRPGDQLRFCESSLADAHELLLTRERD